MRVRLIIPCKGPNPRYDWSKRLDQQMFGGPEIDLPVGFVTDGKYAWLLMKNGQAEPADDEAQEWWDNYTGRVAARQEAVAAQVEEQRLAAAQFDDEADDNDD